MNESFWNFPHASKIDVLKEPRHAVIINKALADQDTGIMPEGSDWMVFGEEEALLIQCSSFYLRIILHWYYELYHLFTSYS